MSEDDYLELEDEQIEVLTGLSHFCPICFSQLSYRGMPNVNECYWHCPKCGTEWEVGDLIEALNYNELEESNVW